MGWEEPWVSDWEDRWVDRFGATTPTPPPVTDDLTADDGLTTITADDGATVLTNG